jgi:glutathione S-transferase
MLSVGGLLGAPVGAETPTLAAWMARVAERPAVAQEMAAMSSAAAAA